MRRNELASGSAAVAEANTWTWYLVATPGRTVNENGAAAWVRVIRPAATVARWNGNGCASSRTTWPAAAPVTSPLSRAAAYLPPSKTTSRLPPIGFSATAALMVSVGRGAGAGVLAAQAGCRLPGSSRPPARLSTAAARQGIGTVSSSCRGDPARTVIGMC